MLSRLLALVFMTCLVLPASSFADDLYRVKVGSQVDATRLRLCGVQGLVRLPDGFLVLADKIATDNLAQSGLDFGLVASDVSREMLCLERPRMAEPATDRTLIFSDKGIRLSLRPSQVGDKAITGSDAIPLTETVPIEFREPRLISETMIARLPGLAVPLDSVISLISTDSLISYIHYLESLPARVIGNASMQQTRDWLATRLVAYGVDSVAIDSFAAITGTGIRTGWNVVGYKFGTQFPNHRVAISAHTDAVANCPGADDDGSGTAALLEIARVLSDIETDMTIVFGFFDGEEAGLWGSKYYAHQCKARGDSVVYMMNLDMIGEITNTDTMIAYADPPLECSQLFTHLADSLINLVALSLPMVVSDAYPWDQAGYETALMEEYLFSPQYHSARDSSTYIDFDYMTRITQSVIATAYAISGTAWPEATLAFGFPSGIPSVVLPGASASFDVSLTSVNNGVLASGSEKLIYSVENGSRQETPLVSLGAGLYQATLPLLDCGERALFWVQADEVTNGTAYDCDTTWPHQAFAATHTEKIFEDNFETNKAWSVVSQCYQDAGRWERGMPAGAGFRKEAVLDFDNSGKCYQTGNRFYQQMHWVLAGYTTLTSPAFDIQGADALIHLAILYSNGTNNASHTYTPYEDTLFVLVRGGAALPWQTAFIVGPAYRADGGWYEYTFRAGDFITPSGDVRIMIYAEDINNNSIVDAAVDDVWVMKYDCAPLYTCGDANGDGSANVGDAVSLINYVFKGGAAPDPLCVGDANGDGSTNVGDAVYLIAYVFQGGAPPVETCCP